MAETAQEQINEKLQKIQTELSLINFNHAENLQIKELNKKNADELRNTLAKLRRQLNKEFDLNQSYHCQKAIHDALIFLAKKFPLNEKTKGGQWMCPVTLQTFDLNRGVALSNGCYYSLDVLGEYASGLPYFPSKMPGSEIEIDYRDLKEVQSSQRINYLFYGSYFGGVSGILTTMGLFLLDVALKVTVGISLLAMLETALISLGATAAMAGLVTTGLVFLPIVIGVIAGVAIGLRCYDNNHPSTFAPTAEIIKSPSSTTLIRDELEVNPDPINEKGYHADVEDEAEHAPLLREIEVEPDVEVDNAAVPQVPKVANI